MLLGHFGDWALLAGLGVSLLVAYAVLTVNYLFFAIFLTDFVVVLLALLGLPADQTALDRLIGHLHRRGPRPAGLPAVADLGTHLGQREVRPPLPGPGPVRRRTAGRLRAAGHRRGQGKPRPEAGGPPGQGRRRGLRRPAGRRAGPPPVSRELAQALVSSGHRLALASLALEAAAAQHQADQGRGGAIKPDPAQLGRLADAVRQAVGQLAESLRRLGPPGPLPPLREIQSGLGTGADDQDALVTATDSLVDALNTTAHILSRHLGPAGRREAG